MDWISFVGILKLSGGGWWWVMGLFTRFNQGTLLEILR